MHLTFISKVRGTGCYSFVILSWYLSSLFWKISTIPLRPHLAVLHSGYCRRLGFLLSRPPRSKSKFLCLQFKSLTACLVSHRSNFFFLLFAIAFHVLENCYNVSPWFSLLKVIALPFCQSQLWIALFWTPTNKSISFLKENHCIFTQDHFMPFCSLCSVYMA